MQFDISLYETADQSSVTINNPKSSKPLLVDGAPVVITVWGPGSAEFMAAKHASEAAAAARAVAAFRADANNTDTPEQAERDRAARLAACTASISANFPVAPLDLYLNPKLDWITRQVVRHLDADANFLNSLPGS